jgi:hypothetical protein
MASGARGGQPASRRRQARIPRAGRSLDHVLEGLERTEKRVVACSFLIVKIVSIVALVVSLILLEGGGVRRIWEIEAASAPAAVEQRPGYGARADDPRTSPPCGRRIPHRFVVGKRNLLDKRVNPKTGSFLSGHVRRAGLRGPVRANGFRGRGPVCTPECASISCGLP